MILTCFISSQYQVDDVPQWFAATNSSPTTLASKVLCLAPVLAVFGLRIPEELWNDYAIKHISSRLDVEDCLKFEFAMRIHASVPSLNLLEENSAVLGLEPLILGLRELLLHDSPSLLNLHGDN